MTVKHAGANANVWRILIVDDHPLVRAGLSSLIHQQPDMEICGETGKVGEALELVRERAPDLLIVDVSLADGSGLDLVKRLLAHDGGIRILVCSMHDEALFAYRALQAGAMGYIGKEEAATRVVEAIRRVLDGKIWLSANLTERVLQGISEKRPAPKAATIDALSDRELAVFGLIGHGMGPSKIAELLHLSVKTIETHRENIKKKLNLRSGSELTRCALQWTLEQG